MVIDSKCNIKDGSGTLATEEASVVCVCAEEGRARSTGVNSGRRTETRPVTTIIRHRILERHRWKMIGFVCIVAAVLIALDVVVPLVFDRGRLFSGSSNSGDDNNVKDEIDTSVREDSNNSASITFQQDESLESTTVLNPTIYSWENDTNVSSSKPP